MKVTCENAASCGVLSQATKVGKKDAVVYSCEHAVEHEFTSRCKNTTCFRSSPAESACVEPVIVKEVIPEESKMAEPIVGPVAAPEPEPVLLTNLPEKIELTKEQVQELSDKIRNPGEINFTAEVIQE
jgi:hypothetical protein